MEVNSLVDLQLKCLIFYRFWVFVAEDDQEGVMDNLLEALKTGSAFNVNRDRKEGRKRAPRAAGGTFVSLLIVSRSQGCHCFCKTWKPE